MIQAYNKRYLNDAIKLLSNAFDYAINDCKLDADIFSQYFMYSKLISQFEVGNPYVISGMSSVELINKIFKDTNLIKKETQFVFKENKIPEYWAGWALAQYQRKKSKKFIDIFKYVSLKEIISMYSPYHEADISSFIKALDNKIKSNKEKNKIRPYDIKIKRKSLQNEFYNVLCSKIKDFLLCLQNTN